MRLALLAPLLILSIATLGGCRTASSKTIQVAYGDQLEQLYPGMPLSDFEKVIPQAEEFQRAFVRGGTITTYRLNHRYKQDVGLPPETQTLYFQFNDKLLARWGYSRTWGEEP